MAPLSRDNKSLNAKHAAILKDLLKSADNKVCGDCKRNDARWASTNLGVFLCIRCSGIHRGMGVHISRVKSVDLDTWTPEQIANIQKWGNRRVNLYWEAHLRAGHQPPEHKMESFIRSKYESKRWAAEGPVPDPDSLDAGNSARVAEVPAPSAKAVPAPARASNSIDLLGGPGPPTAPVKTAPAPAQPSASNGLLDLDFGAATSSTATAASPPKKDNKADILSLFSNAPPPSRTPQPSVPVQNATQGFAGLSLGATSSNPWSTSSAPIGQQQQQPSLFNSQDVWGSAPTSGTGSGFDGFGDFSSGSFAFGSHATTQQQQKKQPDAFANLWD